MPIPMETINQKTLSRDLDEILDRVSIKQIPTLVTRDNQPRVVILPYETYQQWIAAREQRLRRAFQNLRSWTSKHAEALSELDASQLVREIRNNR